jgi:hypothetical protein
MDTSIVYRIYGILSLRGEVYRVRANTRTLNLVLTFTYVASHFKVCVFLYNQKYALKDCSALFKTTNIIFTLYIPVCL